MSVHWQIDVFFLKKIKLCSQYLYFVNFSFLYFYEGSFCIINYLQHKLGIKRFYSCHLPHLRCYVKLNAAFYFVLENFLVLSHNLL